MSGYPLKNIMLASSRIVADCVNLRENGRNLMHLGGPVVVLVSWYLKKLLFIWPERVYMNTYSVANLRQTQSLLKDLKIGATAKLL